MQAQEQFPMLAEYLQDADVVDIKAIDASVTLREYLAGMFSYMPKWVRALYAIRWGFVRLLGMKQEGVPQSGHVLQPTDIQMIPGKNLTFFYIEEAVEDEYWVGSAKESHLNAYLAVIREETATGNRFHTITLVKYNAWSGPVYFNVIRPFHHIVVRQMMNAGAKTFS